MKVHCNIIRDLLPLYADDACSEQSRQMVDDHLKECMDCAGMLEKLRRSELEDGLKAEKEDVLAYGAKKFRKLSAAIGSTVSGVLLIPIIALLIINLTAGSAMGWFYIMLAGMAMAASLIVVPIAVRQDKAFWTFCASSCALMVLLAVICLVSRGNWFWLVASCVLFGLSVFFGPFVIKARPLQKWVGGTRRWLVVLAVDAVLFLNMMNTIRIHSQGGGSGFLLTAGIAAGVTLVALRVIKNRRDGE
jgi:predicted anti-sigma-YlaC factor YlaD